MPGTKQTSEEILENRFEVAFDRMSAAQTEHDKKTPGIWKDRIPPSPKALEAVDKIILDFVNRPPPTRSAAADAYGEHAPLVERAVANSIWYSSPKSCRDATSAYGGDRCFVEKKVLDKGRVPDVAGTPGLPGWSGISPEVPVTPYKATALDAEGWKRCNTPAESAANSARGGQDLCDYDPVKHDYTKDTFKVKEDKQEKEKMIQSAYEVMIIKSIYNSNGVLVSEEIYCTDTLLAGSAYDAGFKQGVEYAKDIEEASGRFAGPDGAKDGWRIEFRASVTSKG